MPKTKRQKVDLDLVVLPEKKEKDFSNFVFGLAAANSKSLVVSTSQKENTDSKAACSPYKSQHMLWFTLSHSLLGFPALEICASSRIFYTSSWEGNAIKEHDSLDTAVLVCIAWLGCGALRNTQRGKNHHSDNPSQVQWGGTAGATEQKRFPKLGF